MNRPPATPCLVCVKGLMAPCRVRFAAGLLFRCRDCGVVQWGTGTWTQEAAASYYQEYYRADPAGFDPITDKRFHELLDTLQAVKPPGRILDVGAGRGHFLTVAESRGWDVTGLEISHSGLEHLRRLKAAQGWKFELRGDDIMSPELPAGAFRAVTLFEVIEHLTDPSAHIKRISDLLEPGGLLFMTTPNFDSLSRRLLGRRWRGIDPEHLFLFNRRSMGRLLASNGLRPVRLLTKNLDVSEIRAKWGKAEAASSAESHASAQALRRDIERKGWLRGLKNAINAGLRLTDSGDTLEVLAVKAEPAPFA